MVRPVPVLPFNGKTGPSPLSQERDVDEDGF